MVGITVTSLSFGHIFYASGLSPVWQTLTICKSGCMDGRMDGWIAEELVCGIFTFVFSIAWQETWGGHHKQSDICLSCGGQVLFETTQVHAGVSMQMKRKAPLRNFVGDDDGEDGEGGRKGEGHVSGAYWQFHCLLDIHSYKGADWGQSTTLCNRSLLVEHILVCNPQHFATIHNTSQECTDHCAQRTHPLPQQNYTPV